ncbi:anti-sigma factor [Candidatus Woesebacteria bacterium]|nr:anti-sigma factor [Candidatus Woesebacteria bacterium]
MNRRDIITGVIILVLVIGGFLWLRNRAPKEVTAPSTSNQENIERSFNLTIPDDVDTADLEDVSGGDGSAVATRKFENGTFTHMVLADLSDPAAGTFYEGWLVRGKMGDFDFAYISTGKLRVAKGGFLLEFKSAVDYSNYNGVVVTLEKVNDKTPETHILEGSF